MAVYNYRLIHRPGKTIEHADALSRSPLPDLVEDPDPATSILLIEELETSPLTVAEIARLSTKDKMLAEF